MGKKKKKSKKTCSGQEIDVQFSYHWTGKLNQPSHIKHALNTPAASDTSICVL